MSAIFVRIDMKEFFRRHLGVDFIPLMEKNDKTERMKRKKSLNVLTSGTVVSYGVFTKTGGLSLTSDTRTIIGMFRLRRVD